MLFVQVLVESGSLVGLAMKDIHTNTTQLYKFANHSYQIGNDLSLLHVPKHSQEECELYRCCVWPPVGHHILQSEYSLPQGNASYITGKIYMISVFVFLHLTFFCIFFLSAGCQKHAVGITEFSVKLQSMHVGLPTYGQCIIVAGVLLLFILSIAAAVYLCKRRKTHTKVSLHISI